MDRDDLVGSNSDYPYCRGKQSRGDQIYHEGIAMNDKEVKRIETGGYNYSTLVRLLAERKILREAIKNIRIEVEWRRPNMYQAVCAFYIEALRQADEV